MKIVIIIPVVNEQKVIRPVIKELKKYCHSDIIVVDDERFKKTVHFDKTHIGAVTPPLVWHEMKHISHDAILLVVASQNYDKLDYIRNYEEFSSLFRKIL
jgi:cellulose synthase/poly-beta-1,6-N-acetylglucosamine synthase-like glycosyltransferase